MKHYWTIYTLLLCQLQSLWLLNPILDASPQLMMVVQATDATSSFLVEQIFWHNDPEEQLRQQRQQQHQQQHHQKKEKQLKAIQIQEILKIEPLIDQGLCNNDPNFHPPANCYNEHRHNVKCDDRSIDAAHCQVVTLQLSQIDEEFRDKAAHPAGAAGEAGADIESIREYYDLLTSQLDEIFPQIFSLMDEHFDSYRRLRIDFPSRYIGILNRRVDYYMTPRPWLSVTDETFPRILNQSFSSPENLTIVIDHYHQLYEQYFQLIGASQYPPNEDVCHSTPVIYNRNNPTHPGWAAVLTMYFLAAEKMPFAITKVHVSRSNTFEESTGFIDSPKDCPHLKNKWECAFLPTSNCTLPSLILNRTGKDCLSQIPDTDHFSVLLTNCSEKSVLISKRESEEFQYVIEYSKTPHTVKVIELEKKRARHLPQLKYLPLPHEGEQVPLMGMGVNNIIYDQFFMRNNAFYRYRVDQLLQSFYSQHSFSPDTKCVAAHIRRGDRSVFGTNMTEFCQKGGHEDFGCKSIPFGTVALTSVLKKAEVLVTDNIRTMFVATDDPLWLKMEIIQLEKQGFFEQSRWRVYSLPPPVPLDNYEELLSDKSKFDKYIHQVRAGSGTASGVYLFATMKLLQQCDAFVGHLGSGISWVLYRTMCYKHGHGKYLATCPPGYDVRSGLRY